jgi:hypothetical protein
MIFTVIAGNQHDVHPVPGTGASVVRNSLGICSKMQEQENSENR